MRATILTALILFCGNILNAQSTESTLWKPKPPNYKVSQAIEIESLFPMFLYEGWHVGVGYRHDKFRLRVSVINGGDYNADAQSIDGEIEGYKRYYNTSPGIFLGYNIWKNLELYGYYERHTFEIEQLSSSEIRKISSNDIGIGISYQFFFGRTFYVQPGIHSYLRAEETVAYSNNESYTIPTFELTPVIRIGARLWTKFD